MIVKNQYDGKIDFLKLIFRFQEINFTVVLIFYYHVEVSYTCTHILPSTILPSKKIPTIFRKNLSFAIIIHYGIKKIRENLHEASTAA